MHKNNLASVVVVQIVFMNFMHFYMSRFLSSLELCSLFSILVTGHEVYKLGTLSPHRYIQALVSESESTDREDLSGKICPKRNRRYSGVQDSFFDKQ